MKLFQGLKTKFYFKTLLESKEITDGEYLTGEFENVYSDEIEAYGNISPANGDTQAEIFGTNISYSKVLIVDNINCKIDENSVLYIDNTLEQAYDYIVKAKAKSKNFISYAIERVDVM